MVRRFWSVWFDWVLLGAWMGVIYFWSNQLNPAVPGVEIDPIRKSMHVFEYVLLFLLWWRALQRARPRPIWESARWALAATIAYAISDEVHQHFVGRDGNGRDVLIDGSLPMLIWISLEVRRMRPHRRQKAES